MKILFLNRELDLNLVVLDFMLELLLHYQQVGMYIYLSYIVTRNDKVLTIGSLPQGDFL